MKVICPRCEINIAEKYINKSKDLAYCESCSDYYLLDENLRRRPKLVEQEELYLKTTKPSKSKIEIKKSQNGATLVIPKGRLPISIQVFMMGFIGIFLYVIYQTFSDPEILDQDRLITGGVFLVLTLLMMLILFLRGHDTNVIFDKNKVEINRRRYFLSPYSATRRTNNLDIIRVYVESDSDGGSVSGILMTFDSEKDLKFGDNLSYEEEKWLAGQLIQLRDALMLDEIVTENIQTKRLTAKRNPVILNSVRPKDSKITQNAFYGTITIPKDPSLYFALGPVLGYGIGVGVFGWVALGFAGYISFFEPHATMKYVAAAFTLVVFLALLNYLYGFIYRAEHKVKISSKEIKVELQPFGINISKIRQTRDLVGISKNRNWNYVDLKFDNARNLRVGFDLSKEDLRYLIGELTSVINKCK